MTDILEITPLNYWIELEFNDNEKTFTGNCIITINLKEEKREILLHADDLGFKNIFLLQDDEEKQQCSYKLDEEDNQIEVNLPSPQSGEIKLAFEYSAKFHSDLLGVYKSKYEYNGKEKVVISTQFEEIYARRAFPCVDHPSKKATFDVEFIIDEDLTGISNTAIKEERSLGNGKKRVIFNQIPKMCTYLLYFGVGGFEIREKKRGSHLVRMVTTPGKTQYGDLGIDMALKSLEYCEDYTSIPYPLEKCDLIAVPDFPFGAMENWGAITFRENLLLYYPEKSSQSNKFSIASVVAHEVTHFWFGDLVSPMDWKYIWLNESFASYFTYAIPEKYYPEWASWEHFILQYYTSSLERDSLKNTFAIELDTNEEIFITPAKVGIIYNKGATILRMLVDYLGEENFKKGISHFMDQFQFDNANTEQYWAALEDATGKPITNFADSWIHQPGYPLVIVKSNGGKIFLSQQRFTYLPNDFRDIYLLPITICFFLKDNDTRIEKYVLDSETMEIELPEDTQTFKLNWGQSGFYRVQYETEEFEKLGLLIKTKDISPLDRFGIANDMFSLVKQGEIAIDYYIHYIENYYTQETDYLPIVTILSNFYYIYELQPKMRTEIARVMRQIADHFFKEFGYEPQKEDKMPISILRNGLIFAGFFFGSKEAELFALKKFQKLKHGEHVSADILSAVYRIGGIKDDAAMEFFKEKVKSSDTPEVEKLYIYEALGNLQVRDQIIDALNYTIEHVPPQTWYAVFYRVGNNPFASEILWPWFKEHFEIVEKQSPFVLARSIGSLVPTGGINYKQEVVEFLTEYAKENDFHKDTIKMALEELEINAHFSEI